MSLKDSITLLEDLERSGGHLRLDIEPAPVDHGDESWNDAVYGGMPQNWRKRLKDHKVSLHSHGLSEIYTKSVILLKSDLAPVLERIAIGTTSIPILNACAIRRKSAYAIALNIRLSSVLQACNAITWDLDDARNVRDEASEKLAYSRLMWTLQHASHPRFDLAMAQVRPFPTRLHVRMSIAFSHFQVLFVLLHECAHIVLGHLENEDLWQGHPLTNSEFEFFASSQKAEYEADAFAADALLNGSQSIWRKVAKVFQMPFEERMFSRKMIWMLTGRIFLWFHLMAPQDRETYYSKPMSHPHPLDRLEDLKQRFFPHGL